MRRAAEKEMLSEHGTELMVLKPSSIWQAAMADIGRRTNNRWDSGPPAEYQHYAFHRKHVEKAETANDIIRAAIADVEGSYGKDAKPSLGAASGKPQTRLLYSNLDLLRKALQ